MVMPGKKYTESYILESLKGRELIVIRSDDEHNEVQMHALGDKIRIENPEWTGTMLVMRTDQSIEKLPEPMAFALFKAMQAYFDPVRAVELAAPVSDLSGDGP